MRWPHASGTRELRCEPGSGTRSITASARHYAQAERLTRHPADYAQAQDNLTTLLETQSAVTSTDASSRAWSTPIKGANRESEEDIRGTERGNTRKERSRTTTWRSCTWWKETSKKPGNYSSTSWGKYPIRRATKISHPSTTSSQRKRGSGPNQSPQQDHQIGGTRSRRRISTSRPPMTVNEEADHTRNRDRRGRNPSPGS